MTSDRYTRVGQLLAVLQHLNDARENHLYLASVSCQFHDLRTVPGGLSYGQKVQDRLDSLDHLIQEMREDIDRECQYAVEERDEVGIDLSAYSPGPDDAA